MAQKLGKDYLRKASRDQAMLKALREKKLQTREKGERVLLHKFIKQVYPNYKFYRFHATLIKQLQKVIDGTCTRLILQVPPRSGKSLLSSVLLPAAYLIAHPDRYVGLSSYSAELSQGFSRKARDFYKDGGGQLDPSQQAVNAWGTRGGGGL